MYLLFYKGTKKENPKSLIWDNLICLITGSRFSHVEIAYEKSMSAYHCWSSSVRDGGVRKKWIDTSTDRWVIIEVPNAVSEDLAIQEAGKKYDYVGLVGTVIKLKQFSRNRKWFCSEIVAEILSIKDSWKYSPEAVYKLYT